VGERSPTKILRNVILQLLKLFLLMIDYTEKENLNENYKNDKDTG
jgi:hypothetical protein